MYLAVNRHLVNWIGRVRWVVLCLAIHAKNRKASRTHVKSHIVSSTSLVQHGSIVVCMWSKLCMCVSVVDVERNVDKAAEKKIAKV